jgi:hypothetical protein
MDGSIMPCTLPVDPPDLFCRVICLAGIDYSYIFNGVGTAAAKGVAGGIGFALLVAAFSATRCIAKLISARIVDRRTNKE